MSPVWYALHDAMTSVNLNEFLLDAYRRQKQGDFKTAEAMYRHVLAHRPDHPDAMNLLATLAMDLHQPQHALPLVERAIALLPRSAAYRCNLASVLKMLGRVAEAQAAARGAVELAPDEPATHLALASALSAGKDFDGALTACERALEIEPKYVEAWSTLAHVQTNRLRPLDAVAAADRGLAIAPDHAALHWNRALAALTAGDFATGWVDFEWRQRVFAHLRRNFRQPPWQRQDLAGKTILLHCEGGFGDAIHFIRFLPEVVRRAGQVLLECPQPLYELFALLPGPPEVLVRDQSSLPPFDFHCPLQSLPFNSDLTLQTIPADVPYLRADPQRVRAFAQRMSEGSNRAPRVGLAWTGSGNIADLRSRTLGTFAPLSSVPGVDFYSLQVGPSAAEAAQPGAPLRVVDLSSKLRDFSDLAGAIENLDLVISVDTSVAHLAGALAKPVWTLVPFVPDFRWMLGREDSPWYPTMRLFRQANRTDWDEPIARMASALRELVGSG